MCSIHPHKWQTDGLETGIMGAYGRAISGGGYPPSVFAPMQLGRLCVWRIGVFHGRDKYASCDAVQEITTQKTVWT